MWFANVSKIRLQHQRKSRVNLIYIVYSITFNLRLVICLPKIVKIWGVRHNNYLYLFINNKHWSSRFFTTITWTKNHKKKLKTRLNRKHNSSVVNTFSIPFMTYTHTHYRCAKSQWNYTRRFQWLCIPCFPYRRYEVIAIELRLWSLLKPLNLKENNVAQN